MKDFFLSHSRQKTEKTINIDKIRKQFQKFGNDDVFR